MSPRIEVVRKFGLLDPDGYGPRQVHPGISIPGQAAVVTVGDKKRIVVDEAMVPVVSQYLPEGIRKAKKLDSEAVVILVKPDTHGPVWKIDKDGIVPVKDYTTVTAVYKAPKVQGFKKFIR